MLVYFLCLASTTRASSCQKSFLGTSFAPPCWVHHGGVIPPLQRSYNSPYAILLHSPAPSPSELGPGMRLSPSASSSPAWTRMPNQAVRLPRQSTHTEAGLFSDHPVSTPSRQEQPGRTPGNLIFPPQRGVFARPGPAAPWQPPQQQYLLR
jgi:hypothetical protein